MMKKKFSGILVYGDHSIPVLMSSLVVFLMSACVLFVCLACGGGGGAGDTSRPYAISGIGAESFDSRVVLTWDCPEVTESLLVEILVEPSHAGDKLVAAGLERAEFTGLSNDTTYTFTLTTIDSRGRRSSPVTIDGIPFNSQGPSAVSGLAARRLESGVLLSWTDPADDILDFIRITYERNGEMNTVDVARGTGMRQIDGLSFIPCRFTVRGISMRGFAGEGRQVTVLPFRPAVDFSPTRVLHLSGPIPGGENTDGGKGRFNNPVAICALNGSVLLICDNGNGAIRKYDRSTKMIETVAAGFGNPSGICVMNGFIYVGDNCAVYQVDPATGGKTVFAGRPNYGGHVNGILTSSRFNQIIDIATDGTCLYVTEDRYAGQLPRVIRRIDPTTDTVTDYAGLYNADGYTDGTLADARFSEPRGLYCQDNKLYIVDRGNERVRLIDMTAGTVSTYAGGGTDHDRYHDVPLAEARLGVPGLSPAAIDRITGDGEGTVYVSNSSANAVFRITTDRVYLHAGVPHRRGIGGMSTPYTQSGDLQPFDNNRWLNSPLGMVWLFRRLWVCDSLNHLIWGGTILLGEPAAGSADGDANTSRFASPSGMTTDGVRTYLVDRTTDRIRTMDGEGNTGTLQTGGMEFVDPVNITTDGETLYVLDIRNTDQSSVMSVVISTGIVTELSSGLGVTGGIQTDGIYLYVSDETNHCIWRIDKVSGEKTIFAGASGQAGSVDGSLSSARFNGPAGMVLLPGMNLYVCDRLNHTVRRINLSAGNVSTIAGTPGRFDMQSTAMLCWPEGIVSDGNNLFLFDSGNFSMRRIKLSDNSLDTLMGSYQYQGYLDGPFTESPYLGYAGGMIFNGSAILFSDSKYQRIRKIE